MGAFLFIWKNIFGAFDCRVAPRPGGLARPGSCTQPSHSRIRFRWIFSGWLATPSGRCRSSHRLPNPALVQRKLGRPIGRPRRPRTRAHLEARGSHRYRSIARASFIGGYPRALFASGRGTEPRRRRSPAAARSGMGPAARRAPARDSAAARRGIAAVRQR